MTSTQYIQTFRIAVTEHHWHPCRLITLILWTGNQHVLLVLVENPVWCGFTLTPSFSVFPRSPSLVLKRILDQNLSSGSMLVILMTNHFFQFRFADPEHY